MLSPRIRGRWVEEGVAGTHAALRSQGRDFTAVRLRAPEATSYRPFRGVRGQATLPASSAATPATVARTAQGQPKGTRPKLPPPVGGTVSGTPTGAVGVGVGDNVGPGGIVVAVAV